MRSRGVVAPRTACLGLGLAIVAVLLGATAEATPVGRATDPSGPEVRTAEAPYRLYLHTYLSRQSRGFELTDSTTTARPVPGASQPVGSTTWPQATTPDGRFIYFLSGGSRRLFAYAIGAAGELRPLPGAEQLDVDGTPVDLVFTPDGRHGFIGTGDVLGMKNGRIQPVAVSPSGLLTANGPAVRMSGADPGLPMLATSADGRHLYATSAQDGTLSHYPIGSDGRLGPLRAQVAAGNTPIFPTLTPDGRFLYTTNERGMNVSGYRITTDGDPEPLAGSPYAAGVFPHGIAFAGDGRFMYVPNALGASISGYRVDDDGELTPLGGSPFPTGGASPELAVTSPSQAVLWTIDLLSGPTDGLLDSRLRKYHVAADGRLTADAATVISTGLHFADGRTMSLVPMR